MQILVRPEGMLVADAALFDLAQTLDCGQCFRFSFDGVRWRGVAGDRPVALRDTAEGVLFEGVSPEEFNGFWKRYFDLERDYEAIRKGYLTVPGLGECARFAPGIRVLRQEPWEALASFILSQNNNVPRIKGIVARLCRLAGEPCAQDPGEPDGLVHAFPSPAALARLSEDDLAPLRAGWRSAYLLDAAQRVSDGRIDLTAIEAMPLPEARRALQEIRGVGPKVAECALLYGMGRMDAFPLDVWMKRAMRALFPGMTPEDFGDTAGIAQQYIFHYCRRHPHLIREQDRAAAQGTIHKNLQRVPG